MQHCSPIQGLRLTDVVGSGQLGLTAQHADYLELHQVRVNTAHGPALSIDASNSHSIVDTPVRR